jgi:glutamate/aspartate transport system permease protein
VFRNIPLLLQMFVWFFVVPELLPDKLGLWFKRDLPNPEFWTGVLALAFYTSGRLAELFRAGLQAVPRGQRMAADATGMNRAQALRYIVMPQALRIILPPLTSEFMSIVKNSSLALTIGVLELTAQSRQIENFTFHGFEAFGAATAFYVLVALVLNLVMVRLQRTLTSPIAV